MSSVLSIVALGFFLGMRHATDPDHVIAVTTMVAKYRSGRHAAIIGAVWGFGHTLTILAVGGGIILFGWVIPARIGLSMELSVGVMLIALGMLNLTGILDYFNRTRGAAASASGSGLPPSLSSEQDGHGHFQSPDDYVHAHAHGHSSQTHSHISEQTALGWLDRSLGQIGLYQLVRPLIVGVVHGLAGSAAIALMVLATIRNTRSALLYVAVFGIGTIAGMMLITAAMAVPFAYTSKTSYRLNGGLRIASGLISLGFGFFIVYQMGYLNGLFSSNPRWTPQ